MYWRVSLSMFVKGKVKHYLYECHNLSINSVKYLVSIKLI